MHIQHFEQTHEIPVTVKLPSSKLRNRRLIHVGQTTATPEAREYERDEPDVI
ncbi:hypothetical protein H7Y63_01405 [Polaromonas sp.]|nr:hypothetical protein [Candidatus Saccharibacteria bacterium]